jgi:hypothetical protein
MGYLRSRKKTDTRSTTGASMQVGEEFGDLTALEGKKRVPHASTGYCLSGVIRMTRWVRAEER